MISNEHKKHSDLVKPTLGNFGRIEFAVVGTTCGTIQALAADVINALSGNYNCAYIDTEHKHADTAPQQQHAFIEYTDKIHFSEINLKCKPDKFQYHQLFNEADLVIANGNHHEAAMQVVVIDPVKEASLKKRIQQLTDVRLFLLQENVDGIFDFIKEAVPGWQTIPVLKLQETEKIVAFFNNHLQENKPVLNGLVLAGGKSVRMGFDKTVIDWHGRQQREHMAELLGAVCGNVYISCRADQEQEITQYPTIADNFTGLGPYGAILSSFRHNPDAAWLVVASDLPLLDKDTLQYLVNNRKTSVVATTFESPFDGLPEPLITIWEPKAYAILLSFLAQGYSCPRKALRNNNVHIIKAEYPERLMNVNTQEELAKARAMLTIGT